MNPTKEVWEASMKMKGYGWDERIGAWTRAKFGIDKPRWKPRKHSPPVTLALQANGDTVRQWTIDTTPVAAPRMTRRDKWKPRRPCVERYFNYRDILRAHVGEVEPPDEMITTFVFKMPDSWSENKKLSHLGAPHRTTPDGDNLYKATSDALFKNDCAIWKSSQEKRWDIISQVKIKMIWHPRESPSSQTSPHKSG